MIDQGELTIEDLGRKGFKIYQQKKGFRFGTDSVLLAWFAASMVRRGKYDNRMSDVLELGANCGAVSLCMAARLKNIRIDSVELMPGAAEILDMNIKLNDIEDRMKGYNADIRELPPAIRSRQYDLVVFNPPFYRRDRGPATNISKSGEERLAARFQENGTLDDFMRVAASRVIPSSGHVVLIMHGEGLNDVLESCARYKITPTRLMSVHSYEDRNACMVLMAGKKGAERSELKILPPLILNAIDSHNGDIITQQRVVSIYEEEHRDCFI